jgi:anti-anti-sigma factor
MELNCTDLEDGIRRIDLDGRLDIEGTGEVALRFMSLVSTARRLVVVDLSGVTFLASLAISTLIQAARTAKLRGGRLVLMAPRSNVEKVLTTMRVADLFPVCADLESARAALRSDGAA